MNLWDQSSVLALQTIVLVATAGVLVWYTIETRLLRKAQQWPFVMVQALDSHDFIVANVGNSSALNVRIGGYSIRMEDALQGAFDAGTQLRSSNLILHLASGDTATLHADRFSRGCGQGQQTHTWGEAHLTDRLAIITLRLEYQNLAMEPFFADEIIRTSSIKLLQSGRVRRIFHVANQDFLNVRVSADGQIESVQLTPRGQHQLTKPLRP